MTKCQFGNGLILCESCSNSPCSRPIFQLCGHQWGGKQGTMGCAHCIHGHMGTLLWCTTEDHHACGKGISHLYFDLWLGAGYPPLPLVVPHPLSFPTGGVGDRHLVNPKFFVVAHCVVVGHCQLYPMHSWQDILLTFAEMELDRTTMFPPGTNVMFIRSTGEPVLAQVVGHSEHGDAYRRITFDRDGKTVLHDRLAHLSNVRVRWWCGPPGGAGGPSLGNRPLGGGGGPSSLGWGTTRGGGGLIKLDVTPSGAHWSFGQCRIVDANSLACSQVIQVPRQLFRDALQNRGDG